MGQLISATFTLQTISMKIFLLLEKTVCQTISAELRCDCAACQFKESVQYQRNLCSACERCSEMGYPFTSPTSGFKHCSCIGGCSSENMFLKPGHTYCVGCECSN